MKTNNFQSTARLLRAATLVLLFVATACQEKKTESADTAAAGVEVPAMDIHTAVVSGNLQVVQQHIAAGSDINVRDPFGGSSPLISAAVFGKTEIAQVLLDAGASIDFQNNDGSTALHSAAFFGRPEIVKLLLAKGADKSIKNKYNATAYENVAAPFADMKPAYDMMVSVLGPMGLTLDYAYLEKVRPEIAALLK
ncbi:MAG: ankyrin repeat domain-containing protein [Cyclobacteriaceae bacterium]